MLGLYDSKRPKGQDSLLSNDSKTRIGHVQGSDGNNSESGSLVTKDIIFYFDYYKGINKAKNTEKLGLKSGRNNSRIYGCKWYIITLNPLLLLDNFQIGINQYKIYFFVNNVLYQIFQFEKFYYIFNYLENTLLYRDSSQEKCNQYIHNKLGFINKIEEDNNFKIYKGTKFVSSFRTLFYETLLNKEIHCLLWII